MMSEGVLSASSNNGSTNLFSFNILPATPRGSSNAQNPSSNIIASASGLDKSTAAQQQSFSNPLNPRGYPNKKGNIVISIKPNNTGSNNSGNNLSNNSSINPAFQHIGQSTSNLNESAGTYTTNPITNTNSTNPSAPNTPKLISESEDFPADHVVDLNAQSHIGATLKLTGTEVTNSMQYSMPSGSHISINPNSPQTAALLNDTLASPRSPRASSPHSSQQAFSSYMKSYRKSLSQHRNSLTKTGSLRLLSANPGPTFTCPTLNYNSNISSPTIISDNPQDYNLPAELICSPGQIAPVVVRKGIGKSSRKLKDKLKQSQTAEELIEVQQQLVLLSNNNFSKTNQFNLAQTDEKTTNVTSSVKNSTLTTSIRYNQHNLRAVNAAEAKKSPLVRSVKPNKVPLRLRNYNEINYAQNKWSLQYLDAEIELEYQKSLVANYYYYLARLCVVLGLFSIINIIFVATEIGDNFSPNMARIGLLLGNIAALALFYAVGRLFSHPFAQKFQVLASIIYNLAGILFIIQLTVFNHSGGNSPLNSSYSSAHFIIYLLLSFVVNNSQIFYFHTISANSLILAAVYIILAGFYIDFSVSTYLLFFYSNLVLILVFFLASCASNYISEYRNRLSFQYQLSLTLVLRERNQIKAETADLRSEVYVMTLEKYDIIDLETNNGSRLNLDLSTPLEQAMLIVQKLINDRKTPPKVFLELQKLIVLLGSSSTELFRPKVEELLDKKRHNLDAETERYLFDLVLGFNQQETTGNQENLTGNNELNSLYGTGFSQAQLYIDNKQGIDEENQQSYQSLASFTHNYNNNNPLLFSMSAKNHRTLSTNNLTLVQNSDDKTVSAILSALDSWEFDCFDLATFTNGKPLLFIGMALFKKYNLINRFNLDTEKLSSLLQAVENGYYFNPYHNSTHASDVARTVHYFLRVHLRSFLSDLEILAIILASLLHDFNHPGKNNAFHIATGHNLAILYNDRSILENHHAAQAFITIQKPENNIFAAFKPVDFSNLRKIMLELILSTDLSLHFDFLSQFKSAESSGQLDKNNEKAKLIIAKMTLKAADLGHAAKPLLQHIKWTNRISEEFYRQGDEEKKRNLAISPFMDRDKANVAQSQIGFFDFLVTPLFTTWIKYLDSNSSAISAGYNPNNGAATTTNANHNSVGDRSTSSVSSSPKFDCPSSVALNQSFILDLIKNNRNHWREDIERTGNLNDNNNTNNAATQEAKNNR
jgi:hypothetical protein